MAASAPAPTWVFRCVQKATAPVTFDQGRLACAAQAGASIAALRTVSGARRDAVAALSSSSPADAVLASVQTYLSHLVALGNVPHSPAAAAAAAAASPTPGSAGGATSPTPASAPAPPTPTMSNSGRIQTATNFKWSDCVSGVTGTFGSIEEEECCMLMALAIWCLRKSASLPFSSDGEDAATKEAFHCLRRAAGLISFVSEQRHRSVSHHPGTDFDERVLKAFTLQALAEAEEITLERGRQRNHSPPLLASIAADIWAKFTEAAKSTSDLRETTLPAFRKYLPFKIAFYEAYMLCYQGIDLFNQEKCGDSLKVFQLSQEALERARKAGKEFALKAKIAGAGPAQHVVFTNLESALKKAQDKAVRENGLIYHQRTPAEAPALPEPKCLVQPESYSLPAPADWPGVTLDPSLVPLRGQNKAADIASSDATPMPPAAKVMSEEQYCVVS